MKIGTMKIETIDMLLIVIAIKIPIVISKIRAEGQELFKGILKKKIRLRVGKNIKKKEEIIIIKKKRIIIDKKCKINMNKISIKENMRIYTI